MWVVIITAISLYTSAEATLPPRLPIEYPEINNEDPYSLVEPIQVGTLTEPVIFEPLRNVKFSRSTFKITTFIDFTDVIESFRAFELYLSKFLGHLTDPHLIYNVNSLPQETETATVPTSTTEATTRTKRKTYVGRMIASVRKVEHSLNAKAVVPMVRGALGRNPAGAPDRKKRRGSEGDNPCVRCLAKEQLQTAIDDVKDITNVFLEIKRKFYDAVDHLDPSETELEPNETYSRQKRYAGPLNQRKLKYADMTPLEKEWLEGLLQRILEIDPSLEPITRREKRFVADLLMGWGIFSNHKSIKKIKKNIKLLHARDELLDKKIREVANYLNLTAHQARENTKALYAIDERVLRIDNMLTQLTQHLGDVWYYAYFMVSVQLKISKLTIGLATLSTDVDKVYEYMRLLATHKINPVAVPPPQFRKCLLTVNTQVQGNPRLELPYDPEVDIWPFYTIVRVTPVVVDDLLIIVLTIPLVDRSLRMNLYRVHNLPAVHPELKIQARYELEGSYFAIDQHGLFASIPTERDIQLCLASGGGLCTLNQALYPLETLNWCLHALFTRDKDRIQKLCKVRTEQREGNLAHSLGGYLWAISSMATHALQVRCMKDTMVLKIHPPLQIVHIGNGCEGYSPSITIPAKSELTADIDQIGRANYFLKFNPKYVEIRRYGVWVNLKYKELPPEQVKALAIRLPELPPMSLDLINKKLPELDPDSKWELSTELTLGLMAVLAIAGVVVVVFALWRLGKLKQVYRAIKPLGRVFRGKSDKGDMDELHEILSSILSRDPPGTPPPEPRTTDRPMPTAPEFVASTRAITLGEDTIPEAVLPQGTEPAPRAPQAGGTSTHPQRIGQRGAASTKAAAVLLDILKSERQAQRYADYIGRKNLEVIDETDSGAN